ncbi:MAG: lytic transglycosylase domain-containing protein, partial [Verrucomicrobiaceae bacterium]
MNLDLSNISTEDLQAFQSGDLSKVSTEALQRLSRGSPAAPQQQPPANPKRAQIESYLSETDKVLGLTPGTSARQIQQESQWNPQAVSPRGARGLAQVMPETLKNLSSRFGRPLDPHNERDALEMHRELMRENLAKWGNEDDALRAYNAGWKKERWDNPETRKYLEIIKGGKK